MPIFLPQLDTSQVQGAFGNLANVNAQNAERKRATKKRQMAMMGMLAGAGLGMVAAPALGIGMLSAAGGGAQIGSSLFTGDPVGVGMGALNMGGMAEKAQAGQAVRGALEGMQTPGVGPGELEAANAGMVPLTPQQQERNSLLGAFSGIARTRPDLALQGALGLRTPEPGQPKYGFTNVPGAGLVRTNERTGEAAPTGITGAQPKYGFTNLPRSRLVPTN